MKTKSQTALEKILSKSGEFAGCTGGPEGSCSFHIWKPNAKAGDKCKCGRYALKQPTDKPIEKEL